MLYEILSEWFIVFHQKLISEASNNAAQLKVGVIKIMKLVMRCTTVPLRSNVTLIGKLYAISDVQMKKSMVNILGLEFPNGPDGELVLAPDPLTDSTQPAFWEISEV